MLQRLHPRASREGGADSTRATGDQLAYKFRLLRAMDIFQDLSPDELLALDRSTRMVTVRKGRVLYEQGDTGQALFLLKQGSVRLMQHTPAGKRLELAVLFPHTFFGEMPLLGERKRHASAEAIEDCLFCVMSEADIERLILTRPQVALRMLEVMGPRLAEAEDRLQDLAYRSVPERLASLLLRLAAEPGNVVEGVTHQELGDMVGAYRETVTTTLDEFQQMGYVTLARRRISFVDRSGLAAVLRE